MYKRILLSITILSFVMATTTFAEASSQYGIKIRMGGRFDNVRKCVASKPGTKGGIAADITLCNPSFQCE